MKCYMESKKIIIPIGSIKVLGITQPSIINCMEKCFNILLKMQELIAHNKQQHTYIDDESSGGGRPIPKNETK